MRKILATIPLIALLPTWCGAKTSRLMSLPLKSPDMAAFCEAPRYLAIMFRLVGRSPPRP